MHGYQKHPGTTLSFYTTQTRKDLGQRRKYRAAIN
jgi:hypothetical protein